MVKPPMAPHSHANGWDISLNEKVGESPPATRTVRRLPTDRLSRLSEAVIRLAIVLLPRFIGFYEWRPRPELNRRPTA